jgi:enoyl-[acyl-carrier protein] reductase I
MAMNIPLPVLTGAKALVVGVANDSSVACACARAFQELGADPALTYLNDKARPRVEPIARQLGAVMLLPLDVSVAGQLEAVFAAIERDWERPDILVHSIAWAPKEDLRDGLLACSAEGFGQAIDVSCNSFIRMARPVAPRMRGGGTMIAMGCCEAKRVVPNCVMGPAKAALEASCRCLACELGPQAIRVHAMSPGPLKTGAASGLKDFDLLPTQAVHKAPLGELVDIMDVDFACDYLATPYARRISGETVYVDGGVHIMA